MQRRNQTRLIIILFLSSMCVQQVYAERIPAILPAPGEEVRLYTDRGLYVVDEELFFAATLSQPEIPEGTDWSQVVYVELIRWDGSKLVQAKVQVKDGLARGSMVVPDDLNSGNYYLRAYTKWMRNYSPYSYTYVKLKIINPKRRSIDPGPAEGAAPAPGVIVSTGSAPTGGIEFSGMKSAYGTREPVHLEIGPGKNASPAKVLVSVRRKTSGQDSESNCFSFENQDTLSTDDPAFLPEIYGLSVSGRIVDSESGEPVAGATINLSSYSNSFYFSTTRTGEDGFFAFTLPPKRGMSEMHLAEESASAAEHELLITSEYCNQPVSLPYEPFSLDDEERAAAKQLIVNAQLGARFRLPENDHLQKEIEVTPFYGNPVSTTYVKEYIELIDLREFFFELVQPVLVNYNSREPYLTLNTQGSLAMFPPLVLMDNIPVENGGRLLEIPSARIDRIEVINKGYLVNNTRYSGIISIFSEGRDMGGLEMDEERHFFNFGFFNASRKGIFPAYDTPFADPAIPDLRNLLYWQPELQLAAGETQHVRFYTGDAPGTYEVVVRSIGEDGNALYGRREFLVE